MSQVLNKEETAIWNEVSRRDLSKDISLKSGLRTPKCVIDSEIKKFKQSAGETTVMKKLLKNIPDEFLAPPSSQTQSNDPSDSLKNKPTPLVLSDNDLPAMSQLDNTFISNFSNLMQKIDAENPYANNVNLDDDYCKLKHDCATQVLLSLIHI